MKHADYIKKLKERGSKAKYASEIGISASFLRQIEVGLAITPKRIYTKVVEATNGNVNLIDLINETITRNKSIGTPKP